MHFCAAEGERTASESEEGSKRRPPWRWLLNFSPDPDRWIHPSPLLDIDWYLISAIRNGVRMRCDEQIFPNSRRYIRLSDECSRWRRFWFVLWPNFLFFLGFRFQVWSYRIVEPWSYAVVYFFRCCRFVLELLSVAVREPMDRFCGFPLLFLKWDCRSACSNNVLCTPRNEADVAEIGDGIMILYYLNCRLTSGSIVNDAVRETDYVQYKVWNVSLGWTCNNVQNGFDFSLHLKSDTNVNVVLILYYNYGIFPEKNIMAWSIFLPWYGSCLSIEILHIMCEPHQQVKQDLLTDNMYFIYGQGPRLCCYFLLFASCDLWVDK